MSQEHPVYGGHSSVPHTLEAFTNRHCTLRYDDPQYQPPEPEEVAALIAIMGWSQNDVAKKTGVKWDWKKGSSTVRRWKTSKSSREHRDIPYAAWRLLLLESGVVSV